MARRSRRAKSQESTTKKELGPSKSPATFLFFWLVVPMALLIGYAAYLRHWSF